MIEELRKLVGIWDANGDAFHESPFEAIRGEGDVFKSCAAELLAILDAEEAHNQQLRDKMTCMCGGDVNHSPWEGHTPVSMYDYYLDQAPPLGEPDHE